MTQENNSKDNNIEEKDFKALYEQAVSDLARQRLLSIADLENARKAHQKDMQEHGKYANEKLILALVPLIDTFDLALQYAKDDIAAKPIHMLRNQFMQLLQKHNVSIIPVQIGDMFDASIHEALETIEHADMQDNQIASIEQFGYKLHDRVIRAAKVTVVRNTQN